MKGYFLNLSSLIAVKSFKTLVKILNTFTRLHYRKLDTCRAQVRRHRSVISEIVLNPLATFWRSAQYVSNRSDNKALQASVTNASTQVTYWVHIYMNVLWDGMFVSHLRRVTFWIQSSLLSLPSLLVNNLFALLELVFLCTLLAPRCYFLVWNVVLNELKCEAENCHCVTVHKRRGGKWAAAHCYDFSAGIFVTNHRCSCTTASFASPVLSHVNLVLSVQVCCMYSISIRWTSFSISYKEKKYLVIYYSALFGKFTSRPHCYIFIIFPLLFSFQTFVLSVSHFEFVVSQSVPFVAICFFYRPVLPLPFFVIRFVLFYGTFHLSLLYFLSLQVTLWACKILWGARKLWNSLKWSARFAVQQLNWKIPGHLKMEGYAHHVNGKSQPIVQFMAAKHPEGNRHWNHCRHAYMNL